MTDCPICDLGLPAVRRYLLPMREVVGHVLPELRPSRNRSARIRKKLNKRLAVPLLGPPRYVSIPASAVRDLRGRGAPGRRSPNAVVQAQSDALRVLLAGETRARDAGRFPENLIW